MEKKEQNLSLWTDIIEQQIVNTGEVQRKDLENALAHITEEKDKGLFGLLYYYQAFYCMTNGRQGESLEYLNEAIRCMLGTGEERHVARCYNMLGVVAHGRNNLVLAAEQYEKALSYADRFDDHYMRNLIVSNLADLYYRIGSYEKAFECYREGMREYERSGDTGANGLYNYMLLLSGYGYCLAMAEKQEEAEKVAGQMYARLQEKREGERFPELNIYTFFTLLCYRRGNREQVQKYLDVAVRAAIDKKNVTQDMDSFMNLIGLLIMMKRYDCLGEILDCAEPLAAVENNEEILLQLLACRLEYCGDRMTDEQYVDSARAFFGIKDRYESREYGQILKMMEMRRRLFLIEEAQQRLEEENTRLLYQADHDELSALHNKGCLTRYAEEAVEQARRQRQELGVLFVDIDCFKQMNDCYGHGRGDQCIRAVADCIRECMPEDFAARYGGDEFVVITLKRDEEYIRSRAREIVERVRSRQIENRHSDVAEVLTVTVGAVCGVPGKHTKIWDYLGAADVALYQQKQEKKGCARFGRRVGGKL